MRFHQKESSPFFAEVADKEIGAGLGALERLWAAAYAFVALSDFNRYFKRDHPEIREASLLEDQSITKPLELLSWAADWEAYSQEPQEFKCPPPPWPEGLPRPHLSTEMKPENELFLCTSALLLHHELSHIITGDNPTRAIPESVSLDHEKNADNAAIDWILGDLDSEDPRFKKRLLGIVLAYTWYTLPLFFRKTVPEFKTHPRPYDRLINALERCDAPPDGSGWFFARLMFSLYMSNVPVPNYDPNKVHKTERDYVIYCADLIHAEMERKKTKPES